LHASQLLRSLHRQSTHAHGVEQLKDRRIGADAERERQDGNDGEAGIHAQQARAVTKIAPDAGEERLARIFSYWQGQARGMHGGFEAGDQSAIVQLPQ